MCSSDKLKGGKCSKPPFCIWPKNELPTTKNDIDWNTNSTCLVNSTKHELSNAPSPNQPNNEMKWTRAPEGLSSSTRSKHYSRRKLWTKKNDIDWITIFSFALETCFGSAEKACLVNSTKHELPSVCQTKQTTRVSAHQHHQHQNLLRRKIYGKQQMTITKTMPWNKVSYFDISPKKQIAILHK